MLVLAATLLLIIATLCHAGYGWLVALVLFAAITGYLGLCWLRPFTGCKHRATLGVPWKCNACDGTGRRVRTGRRMLHGFRDAHRRPKPPK